MTQFKTTTSIKIEGFDRIIFKKTELKKALRTGGRIVQKSSRKMISKRSVSKEGEFPGRVSGEMSRSIKIKFGSGGGWVRIQPTNTANMRKYYPAFLIYGTKRGLKPRKNFMQSAMEQNQSIIKSGIFAALNNALVAQ